MFGRAATEYLSPKKLIKTNLKTPQNPKTPKPQNPDWSVFEFDKMNDNS